MGKLPREYFVPKQYHALAYGDHPLPLGYDATISQPLTIAQMLEFLDVRKGMNVLEVGCGCGYVLGLLKLLVGAQGHVLGIDVMKELTVLAKNNLKRARVHASVVCGDGSQGYMKNAPYDRILVSCSVAAIPDALLEQLNIDGVMVIPVGVEVQQLVVIRKKKSGIIEERKGLYRFVTMKKTY
jgi:protein-L-isoaspartate(D-aspartate) O-methyltransferase